MSGLLALYQIDYYRPWLLFIVIQVTALAVFAFGAWEKLHILRQSGRGALYSKFRPGPVFRVFWREVIAQLQLKERGLLRWVMHLLIFYGFLGLALISALIEGIKLLNVESDANRYLVDFWGDLFGWLLLVGLAIALYRRVVRHEEQLFSIAADGWALGLLLTLVVTGFGLEALRFSLLPLAETHWFSFIGYPLSLGLRWGGATKAWLSVLWTLHGLLGGVFIAYIPYSKFTHIIASPVEVLVNASEEAWRSDLYGQRKRGRQANPTSSL